MSRSSPGRAWPRWLRDTAVLTLITFGLHACGTWRAVPITNVETGKQSLADVNIRVKQTGSPGMQTVHVSSVQFPYVEGFIDGDEPQPVKIDLRQVDQLEVYDPQTGLVILAVVGAIILIAALVTLIVALTKKSCPFVYVVTPEGPRLVGEAYSGAITKSTQRADLMPLPALGKGTARLLLANEALEAQYTDQLELELVDHPAGIRALATAEARPILVGPSTPPTQVTDLGGADVTTLVAVQDGRSWESDLDAAATAPDPQLREGLVVTFPRPRAGTTPVLELQGGNTVWMDLVFGRFFALFGDSLDAYLAARDDPASAAGALAWRQREGVDLSVEVSRGDRWERIGVVSPIGPVAARRVAVPLPAVDASGPLRVRLTGGLGFWRFDQVALSELRSPEPGVIHLAAVKARQDDGEDVRSLLAATDGRYQVLAKPGERVELAFNLPETAPGIVRDAFLFTRGYYLVYPSPDSTQSTATLRTLRDEPHSLSRFSLDLYRRYRELALAQTDKAAPR